MKAVLKPGKFSYKCNCTNCDCIFAFTRTEAKVAESKTFPEMRELIVTCPECGTKNTVLLDTDLEEFEEWLEREDTKGHKCIHGGVQGGPGFLDFGECEIHHNVRYGCDTCPKDCKDYNENSRVALLRIFRLLKSHYN